MLFKPGEIQPRWKYFHKDHPWRVIPAIGSSENIQELNWLQRIWLKIQYQPILKHEIMHHSFNWSTWTGLDLVWVLFYPKSLYTKVIVWTFAWTILSCQDLICYVLILTWLHHYKCIEIEILWSYQTNKKCTRVPSRWYTIQSTNQIQMPCRSSCFDYYLVQTFWNTYLVVLIIFQ